jgi:hypothetical protein
MDLRSKRFVDKVIGAFITAAMTVLMLGFAVFWITDESDSPSNPNTVIIEYDCREVFASPDDYHDQVVSECLNLPRFFKKPTLNLPTV